MAQCAHCGQSHPAYVSICPVSGQRISPFTLVNEDEILVGSVVGERYHVRDVLGQGTTGTVFAVDHLSFPRPAAMKVLRPRYLPLENVIRVFHGEARTAFTVAQECLPAIFDVGQLPDGAPYFLMERLHGETLARRIHRERLSLAAAVDVMMQILSAIETIHARDLLLRDLRPQNVYLSHRRGCRPVVKILDFGLARLVPLEKVQEEWDSLRGSAADTDVSGSLTIPYYLSPERARGEHGVEPASDLFVAATIFYEALTGERPFHAGSFNGLLLQIAQAAPSPMRQIRPEIPTDLDDLVLRALSASPRGRPASAREFQDELRSIFEGARRGSAHSRAAVSISMPMSGPTSATPPTKASQPQPVVAPEDRPTNDRTLQLQAQAAAQAAQPDARRQSSPQLTITREAVSPVRSALPFDGDPYEEEQTKANVSLANLQSMIDEASADNPQRTVPPPAPGADIQVDVDFEEERTETSRPDQLDAEVAAWRASRRAAREDDDTETMQLSPELRSRIDEIELRESKRTPSGQSSLPPPTTRAKPRQG